MPGLGVIAGRCRRLPADAEGAARRLELARDPQAVAAARRDRTGHAGLLHPLVRAPRSRPRRSPPRPTPRRSRRWSRPSTSSASSSIPRSRATAGVRMLKQFRRAVMLSKRLIACLDVSERLRRQRRAIRGAAQCRRSGGARAPLQRRRHRRAGDPRRHRDARIASGARRDDPRGVAGALHPAGGRRRHPVAGRCGSGDRGRRGQGQREQRGADRSDAASPGSPRATAARRSWSRSTPSGRTARFAVYSRSGSTAADREAVEWAREAEARGAGEILLTSIDRDGTRDGFDCELTAAVSDAVSIPVIASGGAGTFQHFLDVFTTGRADAALAAIGLPLLGARGLRAEAVPVRPGRPDPCSKSLTLTFELCESNADSFNRPHGRPHRPARAGRTPGAREPRHRRMDRPVHRLAEGAADRSRRGEEPGTQQ